MLPMRAGRFLCVSVASLALNATWHDVYARTEVAIETSYYEELKAVYDTIYSPVNAYVAEIPMRADVNEYGAVVIDVPLELPDVGGYLQPGLSLRYNSSRPATMFGNEWKLEGFSEIYQVDKSVYYDGVAEPFDEDDAINGSEAFVMDGQRLIMKQNNFPQSVIFQSETGFVRAVARFRPSDDNPSGYEYACFEVSYPDGKTAVFGFKDEESSEDKTYFPITRLTNPVGQSVSYEYEYLNEEYRIRHIRFGKDGEVTVRFDYRPVEAAYRKVIWCTIWGDQTRDPTYDGQSTGCALAGISVRYRERPFRDYAFIYRATANYLFLSEIHMVCPRQPSAAANSIGIGGGIGGIDIDVPPIEQYRPGFSVLQNDTAEFVMPLRFCYGDNQSPTYSSVESRSFAEGIVSPCSKKGAFGNDRTSGVVIYPATAEGGGHIIVRPDLEREDTLQLPAGRGAVEVLCLNMDQTPGDEIVRVNNYVSGGADVLEFAVYALDAGDRPQLRQVRTFSTGYPLDNGNCTEKRFFIGNLAGRGSVEVMAVSNLGLSPADSPLIELYDLAEGHTLFSGTVSLRELGFRVSSVTGVTDLIHRCHHWLPGDFDGDGQTEFFFRPNEVTCGAVVKFAVVDGVVEPQSGGMSIELANRNDYTFVVGDFNGDRLSDVYISSDGEVYMSDGKQLHRDNKSYALPFSFDPAFCADINGDGCDDVVLGADAYFFAGGEMLSMMTCEGAGSFTRQDYMEPEAGKFELLHVGSETLTRYTYGIDLSKDLLISGVKSSFGVETRFYYGKLKDTTVYRKTAPPPAFPYQQLYSDATVVRKVRRMAGGQVVSEKDYRYEDAVYHRQGLGFCGFGRVVVTDSIRGQSASYTFDPVRFNVPLRVESPVQTVSNTYNVSVAADKTAVITLENAVQTDKLKGTSVTTSYLYDNYGQPVQATVNYDNGVKRVTDYRYRNTDTEAQYQLGLITSQTETLYQGNAYASRSTTLTRNAAGLVENTRSYYDGRLVSEESTPRDGNGWVQSRTVEQYGSGRQLTTTYQYDDWGRVTRETDPTGLSITYSYDADGRLAQTTDARNQVTNYEYDLFGRQVRTRSPQGLVTEMAHHWNILEKREDMAVIVGQEGDDDVPNMPEQARYAIEIHAYGVQKKTTPLFEHMVDTLQAGTSVVYYDALGREMRTAELRFDGSWLKQDRQYDSRGRLWKESLPYKADAPSWWNVHNYDAYDRPTAIQYASGREDTWTYSGLSVTSRVDGTTSTKTYDVAGRLTQATDGGGTITYTYRPDGQWQSVSTAGTVTTFAYDEYGRQASITDPSAGVQQCGYDAAGNLGSQTDAEGRTIAFEYDEYNRLVWRETPEMATAYYYNVYGQPDSIVSDNGTARSFTYDAYGRVSTERETAPDGKWLEKSASYNPAGGLESVQYSSQSGTIGTELYTYANGYLVELALRKPAVREVWPGGGGIVPVEPQPGIIIGGVQNAPSADAPVIVLPPGSVSGERYNPLAELI